LDNRPVVIPVATIVFFFLIHQYLTFIMLAEMKNILLK